MDYRPIKISVITCVYNGEKTIEAALDSIVQQTFQDWELIICNDASTDSTPRILAKYAHHPRIQVINNESNLGPGISRNNCIKIAKAPYIVVQDADDTSTPNRLEILYTAITNSDSSVIGSFANLIDNDFHWGTLKTPLTVSKSDWIKGMKIVHASIIARKDAIEAVGGYSTNKKDRSEDYLLMCKMASAGYKISSIPFYLYNIKWGKADYKRRNIMSRVYEGMARFKAYNVLRPSPWMLIYCLKPLLISLVPNSFIYNYHGKKFSLSDEDRKISTFDQIMTSKPAKVIPKEKSRQDVGISASEGL